MSFGVYVHFPYCLKKCPYCDFTSYATPRDEVPHEAYADAVIHELDRRLGSGLFAGRPLSVFFGGGTPSLWRPEALGRVLGAIRDRAGGTRVVGNAPQGEPSDTEADSLRRSERPAAKGTPGRPEWTCENGGRGGREPHALDEVTVECNPSSLDRAVAAGLAAAGVNRLSIGVQSLRPEHLAFLGRLHDGPAALVALAAARASVARVSADLIFGMPGHTARELVEDVHAVLETGVEHVSVYALTIEPRTAFGDLHRRGLLQVADDDRFAELYEAVGDALAARGLEHYEISNWSLPGRHALGNRVYWEGLPYLGLGTGAFGSYRVGPGGVRYRNTLDPGRYVASDGGEEEPWREELSPADLVNEGVLLGLRLREGVDLVELGARHGVDALGPRAPGIADLVAGGLLLREGDRIRIPQARWLLADRAIRRLIV